MREITNPLDFLIEFCENSINKDCLGLSKFHIFNAKDELKKIRASIPCQELSKNIQYKTVAWARINNRGDLYDLRLHNNPYIDPATVIPLYVDIRDIENNERTQ